MPGGPTTAGRVGSSGAETERDTNALKFGDHIADIGEVEDTPVFQERVAYLEVCAVEFLPDEMCATVLYASRMPVLPSVSQPVA